MIAPTCNGNGSCELPAREADDPLQPLGPADEHVFAQMAEAQRGRLFKYLRQRGASHEISEDIVQDTFLNALRAVRAGNYRHVSQAKFGCWLRKIALRLWLHQMEAKEMTPQAAWDAEESLEADGAGKGVEQDGGPDVIVERMELLRLLDALLDAALIHPYPTKKRTRYGPAAQVRFHAVLPRGAVPDGGAESRDGRREGPHTQYQHNAHDDQQLALAR